jgi:uncharacterized DUF497 family protein
MYLYGYAVASTLALPYPLAYYRADGVRVGPRQGGFEPSEAWCGFPTATKVFDDPNIRLHADPRPRGETRFQAIGSVNTVILFVSYTMRGDICRIISARRASRRERQSYSI